MAYETCNIWFYDKSKNKLTHTPTKPKSRTKSSIIFMILFAILLIP